jgi:hypothetical protein
MAFRDKNFMIILEKNTVTFGPFNFSKSGLGSGALS